MSELPIRTTRRDGATIVAPSGEIDLSGSPDLREALQRAMDESDGPLLVDLSDVSSIDSSGLATLIEALRRVQSRAGRMVLCAPTERVRSVIEIARLDQVFHTADSVETALEA